MNKELLMSISTAYSVGGMSFIDECMMGEKEAKKEFKKDLKSKGIEYDEKIFKAHYAGAKIMLISGLTQFVPAIVEEPKRKEIINKLYEIVKELYENENKESEK